MSEPGLDIALESVSKYWGETAAVDGIDIAMPAGKFTALLGPSGCGKSTTLRLIAGLENPDGGRVVIGGRDVTRLAPAARNLSMVFQSYGLFPHLSVAENIIFGLKVRRMPKDEREERLAAVATLLELTETLGRKPSQLSGGQQQRVALGRAIISRRPVCLMDEPLSNLDARLRQEMRVEIRALQRKLGFTMAYVTHDQVEAITMADQVVLMNRGRIEQAASPQIIYQRPATLFAARFIGTPPMNLISPEGFGERAGRLAQTPVLIGLRPECLRLDPEGSLEARVQGHEFLGSETLIACGVGEERLIVKTPGNIEPRQGDLLRLGFEPEDVHVFDRDGGERREELGAEIAKVIAAPVIGHSS